MCVYSMYEKKAKRLVAGGMTNILFRATSPHLHRSTHVRPVTPAQSSSHLDRCLDTLSRAPDQLTVLAVASGGFFLVLCPATIDGFGRRTRGAYGEGSSGRGRREEMNFYTYTPYE